MLSMQRLVKFCFWISSAQIHGVFGQSCVSSWVPYNGKCWYWSGQNDRRNIDAAQSTCVGIGGRLASIDDEDELDYVGVNICQTKECWVGLKKNPSWNYIDGNPSTCGRTTCDGVSGYGADVCALIINDEFYSKKCTDPYSYLCLYGDPPPYGQTTSPNPTTTPTTTLTSKITIAHTSEQTTTQTSKLTTLLTTQSSPNPTTLLTTEHTTTQTLRQTTVLTTAHCTQQTTEVIEKTSKQITEQTTEFTTKQTLTKTSEQTTRYKADLTTDTPGHSEEQTRSTAGTAKHTSANTLDNSITYAQGLLLEQSSIVTDTNSHTITLTHASEVTKSLTSESTQTKSDIQKLTNSETFHSTITDLNYWASEEYANTLKPTFTNLQVSTDGTNVADGTLMATVTAQERTADGTPSTEGNIDMVPSGTLPTQSTIEFSTTDTIHGDKQATPLTTNENLVSDGNLSTTMAIVDTVPDDFITAKLPIYTESKQIFCLESLEVAGGIKNGVVHIYWDTHGAVAVYKCLPYFHFIEGGVSRSRVCINGSWFLDGDIECVSTLCSNNTTISSEKIHAFVPSVWAPLQDGSTNSSEVCRIIDISRWDIEHVREIPELSQNEDISAEERSTIYPDLDINVMDCEGPPTILNSQLVWPLSQPNTTYMGVVTYECLIGYWVSRNRFNMAATCGADGVWILDKNITACSKVECPLLLDYVVGGDVERGAGSKINITCPPHLQLPESANQNTTYVCSKRGQWSPNIPECLDTQHAKKIVLLITESSGAQYTGVMAVIFLALLLLLLLCADIPSLTKSCKRLKRRISRLTS